MNFIPAEQFEKYYKIEEDLGTGQFATVKHCVHRVTGVEYAAKFVKKRRFVGSKRGAKRADVEREVGILKEVGGHRNIISLYETYESSTEIILVLELVTGGELFHHVCSKERLCEEEASAFIRQILLGVSHLHNRHVSHLDLKPENIMLQNKNSTQIKIIDFGLSRKIPPGAKVQEMIGTPEFVAPEIINYECLSTATDMWAIGVITYILLSGMSPFMGETRDCTFANISSVHYDFDDDSFCLTSELAKDFIRRLFVRDPSRRATCEECLRHPWIEPQAIEQANIRRESAINVHQIKTFHVRKRWKQALRAVVLCNMLMRKAKLRAMQQIKATGDGVVVEPLETRYDPNHFVMSALMCASEEGNVAGLEELTSTARVDLNMANDLGETAMHVAAGSGQLEVVQFLQFRGANINITDKHGDSPLYWAARQGHTHVVDYLVKEAVPVNHLNKCRETALHVAVRYSHSTVVQNLVSVDGDVNMQDEHGETPLHIASWHGFPLILEILCRNKPDLNLQNQDEETALHCAAARGHVECVQTLLASGANVDVLDKNGQTPLHLAIRRHHVDIALLLLHHSCKLDVADKNGETPLHLACKEALLTVVQTLCHLGCHVDSLNKASLSPLHIAAKDGHLEIVRVLCLAGCNINVKNKDGIVPEIAALAQGCSQVGELLGRLKNDQQREAFIEQLCPGVHPLRRIKLKIFGNSGVGKTKLLESLKATLLGSFFRRRSESSMNAKDDPVENGRLPNHKNKVEVPPHQNYTKGIDVQQANISGSGELSTWDFSGYSPYQQMYDHFVGNTDCIHLVLFKATDPTEVQYQQVVYWMNFLKSRVMPTEPIGYGGVSSKPAHVVIVGTHADMTEPALPLNADSEWTSCEAEAMLKTIKHRFSMDFVIHNQLILVDALQSSCPGVKALKTYIAQCRTEIVQGLPKATGFLDSTVTFLGTLRKTFAQFSIIPWPEFVNIVRKEVNPLAAEVHCRQLIQQLQLMGEVIYLKGEIQEFDYVVLNPQWFCHDILGSLFAHDFLQKCRVTGCYTADDFHKLYPDIPDIMDMMQVLDALSVCAQYETDGDLEYEFAALNFIEQPRNMWDKESTATNYVYGGMRLCPPRGMDHMMSSIFCRIQVHLRRSMQEFQDPVDADLTQWKSCSKVCSGQMEGLVALYGKDQSVEVKVRGPLEMAPSCFYFMEDLANIVEQTVAEVAPGLPLERHFLSPRDLTDHNNRASTPAVYPPETIMDMQVREKVSMRSANNDDAEEKFLDVVCFGSKEVAAALTLGVDLPITQIPLYARRELAALLDPSDSMGRDWSILAVKLGLMEALPEVDNSGPLVSKTDQILAEWALQNPHLATVGALIGWLKTLERADALDILYKTVPLYMFAPVADDSQTQCNDSGVVSNNSHTTSATSQRSSSTLSR